MYILLLIYFITFNLLFGFDSYTILKLKTISESYLNVYILNESII